MAQLAQQMGQGQGMQQEGQGQPQQDLSQGGQPQPGQSDDLAPKQQSRGLKDTTVTLSVADLLDLHSGGKATQSHLKTEQLKEKHQYERAKMHREEQQKQREEQQKQQQEQMMQQQQQQGMMGGGIYGSGPMDGSNPAQPTQPAQSAQPQQGLGI
jgi:hypothetical protein